MARSPSGIQSLYLTTSNGNAAVRGPRADQRTAGAQRRAEAAAAGQLTLHRNWKIDAQAAVDRARLELGVVALRNRHRDAAVARFNVKTFAVPTRSAQRDVETAVAGLAVDAAADVLQLDAAVGGVEAHVAADADDGDAAVAGAQIEIVLARHVDAIADRPPLAAAVVRAGRIHATAAGLHLHLAGERARVGGFTRRGLHDRADANLV